MFFETTADDCSSKLLSGTFLDYSRALSLRNAFLGYECGRVFPVSVRLDSLSRDAANWLSSRFSRSVEMQLRFGCLRMVFTRCASSELQFGALWGVVARERKGALSRKAW